MRIVVRAHVDDLAAVERRRPASEEVGHDFCGRLRVLVLRLHGVEALPDEDAAQRGDRLADRQLVRTRHLAHDVRFLAVGSKPFADALDLRTIVIEARALLGTQADAKFLPIGANQLDIPPVPRKLALRDEEGAAHSLSLHFLQYFKKRRFLRQSAERKDDGGLRAADEAPLLGNVAEILPAQRGIGALLGALLHRLSAQALHFFRLVRQFQGSPRLFLLRRSLRARERRESRRFKGCRGISSLGCRRSGRRSAAKSGEQEGHGAESALLPASFLYLPIAHDCSHLFLSSTRFVHRR